MKPIMRDGKPPTKAHLAEAERFLGLYFAPGPQQDMAVLVLDELSRLRARLDELEAAAVQNRAARQVLKNANKRQHVVIDDLCQRLADGRQVIE